MGGKGTGGTGAPPSPGTGGTGGAAAACIGCCWDWWCSSSSWCTGCCWDWGWSTWRRQRRLSTTSWSSWKLPCNRSQGIGQALHCFSINAGLVSHCKDTYNLSTLRMLEQSKLLAATNPASTCQGMHTLTQEAGSNLKSPSLLEDVDCHISCTWHKKMHLYTLQRRHDHCPPPIDCNLAGLQQQETYPGSWNL